MESGSVFLHVETEFLGGGDLGTLDGDDGSDDGEDELHCSGGGSLRESSF